MANNESFQGVSNCYVFKSRLQEYAQRGGLPTPVYETIKDGPSHEPTFRSTVIVNNVRYDSLPGFFNRKAAEQSAAEVALMKLIDSGAISRDLSPPVHETGLCKNLLQEYAQKMNFAIPQYECQKQETSYSCTVEIGGMRYIGGEAKTKKVAEIKAARTALLAIQSSALEPNDKLDDYSAYTVIPQKKKVTDLGISNQESAAALKPKKTRFKKKKQQNRSDATNQILSENVGDLEVKTVNQAEPEFHEKASVSTQGVESGIAPIAASVDVSSPCNNGDSNDHKAALIVNQNGCGTSTLGINSQSGEGGMTEVNAVTGAGQVTSEVDSSALRQPVWCRFLECEGGMTEVNAATGAGQEASEVDSSALRQPVWCRFLECEGGMTEVNAVTGAGQVTSEVDSSALRQPVWCRFLESETGTDADQGRSTNVEAETS